ncbi:CBO0543 family protein [Bacillus rubiinfantis]|uniref:CBO0543 family protein n=1 Tax=Bacillus rubiinfantis TaxID=1499680 RepID=UPI0005A7B318|nr:CBO0543 family protein [Bacillus rubiinfantis]
MYLLFVLGVYIIFAKLFVDWKRWREFYPTIQFYIICNLLYNFIFYQHTLWRYKAVTVPWLNHTLIEIAFSFFILPVVLLIYLQYFPKGYKKYLYVGIWIAYFSLIEYLFMKKGLFIYEHGWNIWWSTLFNLITFMIIRLHYKNTLLAYLISIPIIFILLLFFHPSLQELK